MKRIITVLLASFVFATLSAQGIKAHLKNGSVITYTYSELDYLEAYEYISDEECLNLSPQEAVDLGLPSGLKWASSNIGAEMPENTGNIFMWGATTPAEKQDCSWYIAPFNNYNSSYNGKYFEEHMSEWLDNYILKPEYDAAHVIWGGQWRMPTKEEFEELMNHCTWKKIETINGIKGYKVTGPNMNSIFIPGPSLPRPHYWTSSLVTRPAAYHSAYTLNPWYASDKPSFSEESRRMAYCIRPVCP